MRIPDNRVQPLSLLVRRGLHAQWKGELKGALVHSDKFPSVRRTKVSNVTVKTTAETSKSFAIDYAGGLSGFLSPDKIDAVAEISRSTSSTVRFSFPSPSRLSVDLNTLGHAMRDASFVPGATMDAMLKAAHDKLLLVVSSVLVCNHLEISFSQDKSLDVSARAETLDVASDATLSQAQHSSIKLASPHELTFAFEAVALSVNSAGKLELALTLDASVYGALPGADAVVATRPPPVYLADIDELIAVDFVSHE